MKEDQAYKVPFDEQKQQALKDYSTISERAAHWSGFIQAAIGAYQDPEVAQPSMKWIAIKNAGDCPEIDNSDFPVEYILRGHRDGGRGKCIIEQTTAEKMWSVASQYDWADYLDESPTNNYEVKTEGMSTLEKWINAILNEDAEKLSIGSVRTLQMIKHEFERLQKENKELRADVEGWQQIAKDKQTEINKFEKEINKLNHIIKNFGV